MIMGSLGWPICIGTSLGIGFYAILLKGPLEAPLLERYFASHPVAYVATMMFFIGLAALLVRALNLAGQFFWLGKTRLSPIPSGRQPVSEAGQLLSEIQALPAGARHGYLGSRLGQAIDSVRRNGSADGLDDDLKYLSDMDADRQHDAYSLVRIIIWATPMLGFLGTVIGITQALGDLATRQLGGDLQVAMQGLLSGLYVAFDTTALALSLSILLMFLQFLVDRCETQLLSVVDRRTDSELVGRFQQAGSAHDPHLVSVERMCSAVIEASEQLVERQSELWQRSMDEVSKRWEKVGKQTGESLADALQGSLAREAHQQWEPVQEAIDQNGEQLLTLQSSLSQQLEKLEQLMASTADVVQLETVLQDNLEQLVEAGHFEQAVTSLSAAIQLLVTRLGGLPASRALPQKGDGQKADERAA
ncbi:MAG: MotA/TolQ/ExbB proton channel family protein [Planctomycetota bacterium]|nr:MotA/TolQ/ExbB proton channel family protein [Planctomycetota bacterium]